MAGIVIHLDAGQVNRLAATLEEAPRIAAPLAARAVRKTAADIERDAKAFCPVDTGNLRASISTTATGMTAEVGPTAYYGIYVELGTSKMAPEAFLGPAFDRHAHELETALEKIARI